jgi:multidrug efflux pump subunit AcrA (membrane-fusion protein)
VKRLIPTACVLAAAALAGCGSSASPGGEAVPPPIEAATATVRLTDVPTFVEAGGVVRAKTTAAIASRLLAPVVEVAVAPGDRVRRGETLIRLDARALDADRSRAAAALVAAEQAVTVAAAQQQSAEAGLQLATVTHERIARLSARRSATPQELDQAVAGLRTAEAQLASARAQAEQAAAALEAARAAADAAQVAATYAVLTAPFDGIVTTRTIDPGSVAAPGVPLATVEATGGYRLEVSVDEARASWVTPGADAEVSIDRGAAESPAGWVRARVAEVARLDPSSHSFVVKLDLPSSATAPSGSFGRARFAGPSRRALVAPASALVRRGQLAFVYVVDAEGAARLRPVNAAPADGGLIELLAGVRAGEVLVASPPPSIVDGARVRPMAAGGRS